MSRRSVSPPAPAPRPIATTVVRSLEAIDVDEWLDRYARAIVDAEALKRTASPEAA